MPPKIGELSGRIDARLTDAKEMILDNRRVTPDALRKVRPFESPANLLMQFDTLVPPGVTLDSFRNGATSSIRIFTNPALSAMWKKPETLKDAAHKLATQVPLFITPTNNPIVQLGIGVYSAGNLTAENIPSQLKPAVKFDTPEDQIDINLPTVVDGTGTERAFVEVPVTSTPRTFAEQIRLDREHENAVSEYQAMFGPFLGDNSSTAIRLKSGNISINIPLRLKFGIRRRGMLYLHSLFIAGSTISAGACVYALAQDQINQLLIASSVFLGGLTFFGRYYLPPYERGDRDDLDGYWRLIAKKIKGSEDQKEETTTLRQINRIFNIWYGTLFNFVKYGNYNDVYNIFHSDLMNHRFIVRGSYEAVTIRELSRKLPLKQRRKLLEQATEDAKKLNIVELLAYYGIISKEDIRKMKINWSIKDVDSLISYSRTDFDSTHRLLRLLLYAGNTGVVEKLAHWATKLRNKTAEKILRMIAATEKPVSPEHAEVIDLARSTVKTIIDTAYTFSVD